MRLLPAPLAPTLVVAGILPTLSIPGLDGLVSTTSKATATTTGVPISAPTGITIASVSYSGSGCPSGSVSSSLSTDKTVSFHQSLLGGNKKSKKKADQRGTDQQDRLSPWVSMIFKPTLAPAPPPQTTAKAATSSSRSSTRAVTRSPWSPARTTDTPN